MEFGWTRRPTLPDGGFSLVETLVAMFIVAVTVTSSVPFFINVLQATAGLGARQAALTVASQQLEYIRSIDPQRLLDGRNAQDVGALIAAPGLVNLGSEVTGSLNSDPAAALGSANAVVRPVGTQTLNGTTFTVRTYINVCYLSKYTGTCTTSILNGPASYRVSVDLAWPRPAGVICRSGRAGQCEYVSTTLIDNSDDPLFSTTAQPTISSLLQLVGTSATALAALHPLQQVTVQLLGRFDYGAVLSAGAGDTVNVLTNTGTAITATVQTSITTGPRTLSVINPDGGSVTTTYTVTGSSPTVLAMTPVAATRAVLTTFTLTGLDFYAAPTTAAPTTQPTVTLAGQALIAGVPTTVSPATSAVTVIGATSLTFKATFPTMAQSPYQATGTLTLVNPDGARATYSYAVTVT